MIVVLIMAGALQVAVSRAMTDFGRSAAAAWTPVSTVASHSTVVRHFAVEVDSRAARSAAAAVTAVEAVTAAEAVIAVEAVSAPVVAVPAAAAAMGVVSTAAAIPVVTEAGKEGRKTRPRHVIRKRDFRPLEVPASISAHQRKLAATVFALFSFAPLASLAVKGFS
ncbi:MAG: hypothetical protein LAP21_23940 [Acidobacteriia bacterium]|nr:hypothetical protein [Terriglobia bacterium]